MTKNLWEMTLEELWVLFPIHVETYNQAYPEWYDLEAHKIIEVIKPHGCFRLNHIGSTYVKGLLCKPTVDILLEFKGDVASVISGLEQRDWGVMSRKDGEDYRIAMCKGYTPHGFEERVFHLHIRPYGDWDELYFRDYLCDHPELAEEYGALKLTLVEPYRHNRDGYTDAKTAFVKQWTQVAREEYKGRYRVNQ